MHGHDVVIFEARDRRSAASTNTASPPTRRPDDFAAARGRLHPLDRRHHGRDRQGARPRLHARRARAATTTRCSSAWASPASTRLTCRRRRSTGRRRRRRTTSPSSARRTTSPTLPVGRRVVVIGGGMTAIDMATPGQAPRRRGRDHRLSPRPGADGRQPLRAGAGPDRRRQDQVQRPAEAADRQPTATSPASSSNTRPSANGELAGTGETFVIDADMVFKAIGQAFAPEALNGAARRDRARGRPHQGRRRAAHLACRASGPAATASPAART